MTRVLLDNARWDFGTSCFVCEPKNERGLAIPFYLEVEERRVTSEFTAQTHHSGAPMYAHGGFCMALLDEGMNWAVIALANRFAVTRNMQTEFRRPVRLHARYSITCSIEGIEGTDCIAIGEIQDADGKVCVRARASFYVMTKEEADRALGAQSQQAEDYTR